MSRSVTTLLGRSDLDPVDSDSSFRDPDLSVKERVADLLSRMTTEEKVGQLLQLDARKDLDDHILKRHAGSILHASPEELLRAHDLVAETRLQIPLIVGEDCIHGHSFWEGATIFPTQLGMAASWDPELVERVARAAAIEISATGIHWTFSPVLCVARDLRWGRVNETFGEDPYLIGELGSAMVRGYQGEGLSDQTAILATAKHFAGYSETQGGRDASEADISHRKLRSWFLPPFERVAKEGCASFMLGYQTTDGVPITLNQWLLSDVLRGEWGYEGTLVTDWDNVGRMVWEQHLFEDIAQASAAAIRAGNDLVMNTPTFYEGALRAIEEGAIDESELDEAVGRILTLKFSLGLFENPRGPLPDSELEQVIGTDSHRELNLNVTRRSLVLLENDGILPITNKAGEAPKRIAVVGCLADDAQTQLGDWAGSSGQIDWMPEGHRRSQITTILDGLRQQVPAEWKVTYDRGTEILNLVPDPLGDTFLDGQPRAPIVTSTPVDESQLHEALNAAKSADYVVAVVGDRIEVVGESRSTATLELLGGQVALLNALSELDTPLIIVLMASKPMVLPKLARKADALIWAANPGMEGGRAIADLILGYIEPTGRLPISFPVHVGQQPIYYNQIRGQHGNRYADLTQEPAYAFGEGLSYSNVEYRLARLEEDRVGLDDVLTLHVQLRNTGERSALETVQVYVRDLVTSASWADKELKAFKQVWLEPGEEAEVTIELAAAACSIVDTRGNRVVEPGKFELLVGKSSRERELIGIPFEITLSHK